MKKILNSTSKKEYKTPVIDIEKLERQDVLTVSNNVHVDAFMFGDSGGPIDFIRAIFGENS